MTSPVLLCSDLDRTLLPNGSEAESPLARAWLRKIAHRSELTLAYVSGRHRALLQQAIAEFGIPTPHFAIGDVGTTIYEIHGGHWQEWPQWSEEIARDWDSAQHADLAALFADLRELTLQEPEKQNRFKLSYYTPAELLAKPLLAQMQTRLAHRGVKAAVIWSIDEQAQVGLIDVLPASATKLHGIRFLMQHLGFSDARTVFAGDSGNDLPVVCSGLQSVLVRNAHPQVIAEAQQALATLGLSNQLYVAQGGFLGMNGNYSAGVLEGLVHFLKDTQHWFDNGL
jgi:HAD superfamily hydrolase (TIGR01484 family)